MGVDAQVTFLLRQRTFCNLFLDRCYETLTCVT